MKKLILLPLIILIISCGKQRFVSLEKVHYAKFRIETTDRFNAVYGVNSNIIDEYIYNDTLITGRFSVNIGDTLILGAYSDDSLQTYMYYVIYNAKIIKKDSAGICMIFQNN